MRVRKFLAVFLLIIVGTIMCSVTSSFAEEIVYEELVVEIPEGEERNAAHYINEKLAIAASNRDKYYKVIINPRENQDITQYYLINQIRVFSNTWLYVNDQGGAKPVVFNKCHKFAMVTAENRDLEVNGYEGFKNIIIEGGIWNGQNLKQSLTRSCTSLLVKQEATPRRFIFTGQQVTTTMPTMITTSTLVRTASCTSPVRPYLKPSSTLTTVTRRAFPLPCAVVRKVSFTVTVV